MEAAMVEVRLPIFTDAEAVFAYPYCGTLCGPVPNAIPILGTPVATDSVGLLRQNVLHGINKA